MVLSLRILCKMVYYPCNIDTKREVRKAKNAIFVM